MFVFGEGGPHAAVDAVARAGQVAGCCGGGSGASGGQRGEDEFGGGHLGEVGLEGLGPGGGGDGEVGCCGGHPCGCGSELTWGGDVGAAVAGVGEEGAEAMDGSYDGGSGGC